VPEVRRDEVREIIEGKHRILYRIEADRVAVLTIRHARQLTTPHDLE